MEEEEVMEQTPNQDEGDEVPKKAVKFKTPPRNKPARLPLGRIKQIIKMDPDVSLVSSESVFLITKATELFIESLSKDAYTHLAVTKMKTILGRHVDSAIASSDALTFLEGALDF
ncbi:DNA polymerase epsilon subunit 4-like [Cimex lectularius]|uniref:Transcription factor CBF/NF-Y/archaeal histone domain-containing protein n=1 Tax=Cimex lectularius TaxID=79782 RepID=A0A8I6S7W0_CIMLE|nr:DNA polymerase epsilon subunit 4-like [Cimex lectularius]